MRNVLITFATFMVACTLSTTHVLAAEHVHATRTEIIEMCKKAEELVLTNKEAGISEIANIDGQFVWKDTYVFLMDFDGNMLAHPAIPQLMERGPLLDLVDKNKEEPKKIIVEFIEIAKSNGEGWIWYKWTLPRSREVADKFTYIRRVGFTDMFVGAGIYK
ncbi:MAG: cache domain-containing protein [Desulfuromonadales bacterium]